MKKRSNKNRGNVLLLVLIILGIAAFMMTALLSYSLFSLKNASRYEIYKDEFAVAESGLNKSYAHFEFILQYGTTDIDAAIQAIQPPTVDGYTFTKFHISKLFEGMSTVTDTTGNLAPYRLLSLNTRRYKIYSRAKKTAGMATRFSHPGIQISQELETRYVPLYLFAIFYDPDCEIIPGPNMDIFGRVHSNSNLYVGSDGGVLRFTSDGTRTSYVTSAGDIISGISPNSNHNPINNNHSNSYWTGSSNLSMWDSTRNRWWDHTNPNWAQGSQDRWNGHVKDSAHDVGELPLPIPPVSPPIVLIQRADANDPISLKETKFEWQAGLCIYRNAAGVVTAYDGYPPAEHNSVSLTYPNPSNPSQTKSVYESLSFYDARELKTIQSLDINIGNLIESGIAPDNGILYVSVEQSPTVRGGVRIKNSSTLPSNIANGFTIATDDPIYVWGNYNTVNKKYSLIAADAIDILSNNWKDSNSTDYSKRTATATTINGVMWQGNVPSENHSNYSGGVENYFRFLENWSGVTSTFNGSIICMYSSEVARGTWGKSNVYSPPNRNWGWDSMYSGLSGPPGTPRVYLITKRNWMVEPSLL
jgi:hypothetical protein